MPKGAAPKRGEAMDRISDLEEPRPHAEGRKPRAVEPLPEGEEAPPPGVRAMGTVRWGLVALMALAAAGAWTYHVSAAPRGASRAEAHYQCPMHPSVVQDHPGACPICGMDLVLATGAARES